MSSRKYYRQMLRAEAKHKKGKASRYVHAWRNMLDLYPGFKGKKKQKKGSKQPILVYPYKKGTVTTQ